jgi:hypothetical protein
MLFILQYTALHVIYFTDDFTIHVIRPNKVAPGTILAIFFFFLTVHIFLENYNEKLYLFKFYLQPFKALFKSSLFQDLISDEI